MKKVIVLLLSLTAPLFFGSAMAQYAIQFDSVGVYLNGTDDDTIAVSFRDRPGRTWRIDTTGTPHLDGAKAGQRVFLSDSVYVILQRSNLSGVADSFKVSYVSGHPTNIDTTLGSTTYLVGGASSFADAINDTTYSMTFQKPSTWFKMLVSQGDMADSISTYFRAIFVRRDNAQH